MAIRGINKVILIGNLGADPEVRYMPSGDAIANLSVATNETWKDKETGENKERTEWHRVVLFKRLAEIAGEYLRRGSKVYIEGKLRTRKWQDQEGKDRYTTEIQADELQMLDRASGETAPNMDASYMNQNTGNSSQKSSRPQAQPASSNLDEFQDDIPF